MRISGYTLLLSNKRWEPDPQPATPSIECRNLCDGKANSFAFFCVDMLCAMIECVSKFLSIRQTERSFRRGSSEIREIFPFFIDCHLTPISRQIRKGLRNRRFFHARHIGISFQDLTSGSFAIKKFPFIAFDFRFSSLFSCSLFFLWCLFDTLRLGPLETACVRCRMSRKRRK